MDMDRQERLPRGSRLRLGYLYGGEVLYRAGEDLLPRLLDDFEFVYLISGEVSYTVDGVTHRASPGAMILGRPGGNEHYR